MKFNASKAYPNHLERKPIIKKKKKNFFSMFLQMLSRRHSGLIDTNCQCNQYK